MELLSPNRNLQRSGVRLVEESFPELHGWSDAIDLNSSLPSVGLLFKALAPGMVDSIGESTVLRSSIPANAHPTMQQVKGSGFFGAGSATVTGLLTTDTVTATCATGSAPTCSVNGTMTFGTSADCWDVYVHRSGVLWAYFPGINVGQTTELDASGNGHHLTALTTTTITERLDGSGTNYCNVSGFSTRENLLKWSDDYTDVSWNKYNCSLVGYTITFADTGNSMLSQSKSDFNSGETYIHKFKAQGTSGKSIRSYIVGPNTAKAFALDGTLQTLEHEFVNNGAAITAVDVRNNWSQGIHSVAITDIQLRRKSANTEYVKTDSAMVQGRQPFAADPYIYSPTYDIQIGVFTDSHYSADGSGGSDMAVNVNMQKESLSLF